MQIIRLRVWLLLALLMLIPSIGLAKNSIKALVGGTLIDGYGGIPIQDSVIIIEGQKIKAIGQVGSIKIPAAAEIISTEGMSVLPGLWDMHVHLMITGHSDYNYWDKAYRDRLISEIMPASALQLLLAGVTSARDLGAPLEDSLVIKSAIKKNEIIGPNLYISGPFLQKKPYPGTEAFRWGVNGILDAKQKVEKLATAGVDVIKLVDQDQLTLDELTAIVDTAHHFNLPVVAHSHRPEEIRLGLKVGIDNFEHTGLATADEYPADVIALLKERNAKMNLGPLFWTPTIQGLMNYEYLRDNPETLDDPSWHVGLREDTILDIQKSIEHPGRLSYFQITPNRRPTLKRKFQQLKDSGVVLLIGTDSGIPLNFHSQSTWRELDTWVNQLGVDPMQAIKAATYWPSVMMKVSDTVGTVSEGKFADIIAVRGNVLRYINLLQDVDIVLKKGTRYK